MKISIKLLITLMLIGLSLQAHSDTYDPATNQLTIPSITVQGITYTDVVITVGSIVSIGGSSDNSAKDERTCSWTVNSSNPYHNIKYELSVYPSHGAIRVALTGLTNLSSFYPINLDLVQDSNATEVTIGATLPGALWQGDYGYKGGTIPSGVIKGGVISRLPSWMDLNEPFKWVLNGEEHIC